jgi:SnoaL-like domain
MAIRPTAETRKEIVVSTVTQLIDRYIAMWNETDGKSRRDLIAAVWTDDAIYVDPVLQADGHAGIDTMVQAVHQRFPGHRFRRTSEVDTHHDRVRFNWQLAPESGAPAVEGVDFGVMSGERLQAITGFFNQASTAAR